jgi:hypothetical protein
MAPHPRCPKCRSLLFLDTDIDLPPELACPICGWRRVLTVPELGIAMGDRDGGRVMRLPGERPPARPARAGSHRPRQGGVRAGRGRR